MQNVMRIARAISKRRKDSVALEVGDLAEAFWYVDFVDRRSLNVLCRWLELDASSYGAVRSGGQLLVAEGTGLILPLSKVLRDKMDARPFSLDNIVGQPSDGAVNAESMARWLLTQELHGQMASKPVVANTVPRVAPAVKPQSVPGAPRPLREQLTEVIFGQDDVINEVLGALTGQERDASRLPLVLFAAGPNASGKTLLAHLLGKILSGYAFRTFEMSTYNSPEDFGLTGLRYGYADAHPGELTSFVRHNPKSIVVFENIERAHPVIQHTLVPAISHGVLRDQYWAGLADRGAPKGKIDVLDGMFGKAREDKPSGVADPDVSFEDCILIFTTSQGEAAYDLPIYNEGGRMRVVERAAMLVDALRAAKEARERSIARGLLNALAEAVVLPFRRLDTPSLLRVAQARLREAAERWRNTQRVAVRIEHFEQMAELYLLTLGCRASPRSLTVRAAEDFLFGWQADQPVKVALKRVTLAMDLESAPGFPEFRAQLGEDPILMLFRKHQVVSFIPRLVSGNGGCRVLFADFRVVTGKGRIPR